MNNSLFFINQFLTSDNGFISTLLIIVIIVAICLALALICLMVFLNIIKSRNSNLRKYKNVIEFFKKSVIEFKISKNQMYISASARKLLNYDNKVTTMQALIENNVISIEDYDKLKKTCYETCGNERVEYIFYCDSCEKFIRIVTTGLLGENSNSLVVLVEDVTGQVKDRKALEAKAHYDDLTGLMNRSAFTEVVSADLNNSPNMRHAMYMLDIDGFKQINDTYGHFVGDNVLQEVAKSLNSVIGAESATCCRMGGDEFCLFIKDIESNQKVLDYAEFICQKIGSLAISEENDKKIACSVGISVYPEHGLTFEELYKHADFALYKSKENCGCKYTLYNKLDVISNAKLKEVSATYDGADNIDMLLVGSFDGLEKLRNILKTALKNEEITIDFIHQYDTSNGKLLCVQSVFYWESKEYGLITPNRFIVYFDRAKLLFDLEVYMMKKFAEFIAKQQSKGLLDNKYSIMQSESTITEPYYFNNIQEIFDNLGIKAKDVIIQMSESSVFSNIRGFSKSIKIARSMGLGISVFAYGSEYASLTLLTDCEIDEVILDRCMISVNQEDKAKKTVFLKEVVAFCKKNNIRVVCDGVENAEQYAFANLCGCKILQGEYVDKVIDEKFYK